MKLGKLIETLLVIIFIGFLFFIICYQGNEINILKTEILNLHGVDYQLKNEIKETQEKCQRMTDTCVDLISNKRWE